MKQVARLVPVVALLALASCATTRGTFFQEALTAGPSPAGSSSVEVQPADTNPDQTGLEVQTNPSDAQVYLNDTFIGDTPLVYTDFKSGTYKITISKRGYYDTVRWIRLDPTAYTLLQTDLTPKTGYITISTVPTAGTEISIDGEMVSAGTHQVPIGPHTVRVRAFGYEEWTRTVDVRENLTTEADAILAKAAFRISALSVSRKVLNPLNPGPLGEAVVSFEVSTYGDGSLVISDSTGSPVFHHVFAHFSQRHQSFAWKGRNQSGAVVANGSYTVQVSGTEADGSSPSSRTLQLTVDRGAFIGLRSILSGSSGLLFAGSPEVLPPSSYSVSSLVLGHFTKGGSNYPVQLAMQATPWAGIEIDGQATAELMSTTEIPFSVGVTGKFSLLHPHSRNGFLAALAVKGTYASGTTNDTFTNFVGLSAGIPVEYRIGPFGVVFMPELIVAPYAASYTAQRGPIELTLWSYARGGIFLDLGSVSTGVSAALRTQPFGDGFGLASHPLVGGWELHWLIPHTQLVLTGMLSGELAPQFADDTFMAGAGIGFVN